MPDPIPEDQLSRIIAAFPSWPVGLQIAGGLAVCMGVGFMAGLGWGLVTIGLEAITLGAMAESE